MPRVHKPAPLFDREREWDALAAFALDVRRGPTLAIVRGRRRLGKSILLRELCATTGGFYHQAVQGAPTEQLSDLATAYALDRSMPAVPAFRTWSEAMDALLALPGPGPPRLVVLDEFPYLVESTPGLPSVVQRALDVAGRRGPRARLVLCGSALSVMSSLLAGRAPLRGRAAAEIALRPFDHREAARFAGLDGHPALAFAVHAVCGGIPGYYTDMLGSDVPSGPGDLDAWMVRGPLNVARPLLHEAHHLLTGEPSLRDAGPYLSVLAAIADGETTSSRIAGRVGRPSSAIAHPLGVLAELGLVERREDVLRPRRPSWQISDPLLRFYATVMRREWANLERGRAVEVWTRSQDRWRSQVLGVQLEELARRWIEDFASAATTGGEIGRVGFTIVNDPTVRAMHEVDVAAVAATGRQRLVLFGEAKLGRVGVGDLSRLVHIRELASDRGDASSDARLVLLTLTGFDRTLVAEARRQRAVLVDAERLYHGR